MRVLCDKKSQNSHTLAALTAYKCARCNCAAQLHCNRTLVGDFFVDFWGFFLLATFERAKFEIFIACAQDNPTKLDDRRMRSVLLFQVIWAANLIKYLPSRAALQFES